MGQPGRFEHWRSTPWRGVVEEYRDWLPIGADTPVVSLAEGGTPLLESAWLSERTGARVWLKIEGANPTGSFKDRGMAVALSSALAEGAEACVCASTGNTSASMAAYAARAGITAIVLVPDTNIAAGKLAQALVHGATVVRVRSGFDGCLVLARRLAESYPVALLNSVNRVRLEGQKTAAFEVVDQLGEAPDIHVLPVGNAGNISAYWKGYQEYAAAGRSGVKPVMWGFQAAGAAPLVGGAPVERPETAASAIRIGNPASWQLAVAARDESGGRFEPVDDADILAAQRDVARYDGVFVEPASATGVAGLLGLADRGEVPAGARIAVTLTGHGLKDTATALDAFAAVEPIVVDPDPDAVAAAADLTS
jgi:threonine synthase